MSERNLIPMVMKWGRSREEIPTAQKGILRNPGFLQVQGFVNSFFLVVRLNVKCEEGKKDEHIRITVLLENLVKLKF